MSKVETEKGAPIKPSNEIPLSQNSPYYNKELLNSKNELYNLRLELDRSLNFDDFLNKIELNNEGINEFIKNLETYTAGVNKEINENTPELSNDYKGVNIFNSFLSSITLGELNKQGIKNFIKELKKFNEELNKKIKDFTGNMYEEIINFSPIEFNNEDIKKFMKNLETYITEISRGNNDYKGLDIFTGFLNAITFKKYKVELRNKEEIKNFVEELKKFNEELIEKIKKFTDLKNHS